MVANVTITGKTGPGETITAGVFNNVGSLNLNFQSQVLSFTPAGKQAPVQVQLDTIATFTCVIAAGVATVTVST